MQLSIRRILIIVLTLLAMLVMSTMLVGAQGPTPQPTPQPIPAPFFTECPQAFKIVNFCRCSQPETRQNLIATYKALNLTWPEGWTEGKSVWLIDGKHLPATVGQPSGQTPTKSASATLTPPSTVRAASNATPKPPTSTPVPLTFTTRGDPTSSPDQEPPLGLIIGGFVFFLAVAAGVYFILLPRLKKAEAKKS